MSKEINVTEIVSAALSASLFYERLAEDESTQILAALLKEEMCCITSDILKHFGGSFNKTRRVEFIEWADRLQDGQEQGRLTRLKSQVQGVTWNRRGISPIDKILLDYCIPMLATGSQTVPELRRRKQGLGKH